jgi:hypothetical protein
VIISMSSRSKYPSKKVLIAELLTAAAALLLGLGDSPVSTVQEIDNNSSIQNNVTDNKGKLRGSK